GRFGERHGLGRDYVLERPALDTREDVPVEILGPVGPAEDEPARPATKGAGGTGDTCSPAITRPAMCAMSAISAAPASWATAPNRAKSISRAYAEAPAMMSLG